MTEKLSLYVCFTDTQGLKIKYTASIRKRKPISWFNLMVSWKARYEKIIKTVSVITSCITLSWTNENGPPLPWKPIRLAGTWKQYSNSAIPQLKSITPINEILLNHGYWTSFKCPYQASVINMLEHRSNPTVISGFIWKNALKIRLSVNRQP